MKFKLYALMFLGALVLSACSDGVPKVDDVKNIVVDGQKMKASEFYEKYCFAKEGSANESTIETCHKVRIQRHQDSTRGERAKWR
ncbi:MAG: hypothetical protein LBU46_03860 [Candidatus Accumulibacter sp.]|jgi:hypothetical protein|nr:hypothetical protein [Accumulibacter sp.]